MAFIDDVYKYAMQTGDTAYAKTLEKSLTQPIQATPVQATPVQSTPVQATPVANTQGYTNNVVANSAEANATYGGSKTAVVTPGAATPIVTATPNITQKPTNKVVTNVAPVIATGQPTQPAQPTNYNLRDIATGAGLTVGNQGNIPTINGTQIDPAQYGLQLVNGRWQGNAGQIGAALGVPLGLRDALEATGRTVDFNPQTGEVSVNKIPIDTSKMINIDGRYYANQQDINSIIASTGGEVPLGSEFNIPQPKDGQEAQPVIDTTISTQLAEERKRNAELQDMVNKIKTAKVPEVDYSVTLEVLKNVQNWKSQYDDQIKQTLANTFKEFNYNPDNDPMLANAIKYADRSMMEEMNRRGILTSTITTDNMRYIRDDLLPKYQDLAYQKYNQSLENEYKRLGVLQTLSNTDYERYMNFANLAINTADKISKNTIDTFKTNLGIIQDSISNQLEINKQEATASATAYQRAWDKFKELGYVDKEVSLLTGLEVGSRSREVEQEILKRYDAYNQLAIQYANNIAERDHQFALDMEEFSVQNKAKLDEQQRKDNAGRIYASLANMSATQALAEVSKNYAQLSDYLGSELSVLIDKLNAQKKQETDTNINLEQLKLQQRQVDISQQNANTAERKAVETAGSQNLTTSEKNEYIAKASAVYKSYPPDTAVEKLLMRAEEIIASVGPTGYKQIWDLALGEAINRGKAQNFNDYFKSPKNQTSTDKLDQYVEDILSKFDFSNIINGG